MLFRSNSIRLKGRLVALESKLKEADCVVSETKVMIKGPFLKKDSFASIEIDCG